MSALLGHVGSPAAALSLAGLHWPAGNTGHVPRRDACFRLDAAAGAGGVRGGWGEAAGEERIAGPQHCDESAGRPSTVTRTLSCECGMVWLQQTAHRTLCESNERAVISVYDYGRCAVEYEHRDHNENKSNGRT